MSILPFTLLLASNPAVTRVELISYAHTMVAETPCAHGTISQHNLIMHASQPNISATPSTGSAADAIVASDASSAHDQHTAAQSDESHAAVAQKYLSHMIMTSNQTLDMHEYAVDLCCNYDQHHRLRAGRLRAGIEHGMPRADAIADNTGTSSTDAQYRLDAARAQDQPKRGAPRAATRTVVSRALTSLLEMNGHILSTITSSMRDTFFVGILCIICILIYTIDYFIASSAGTVPTTAPLRSSRRRTTCRRAPASRSSTDAATRTTTAPSSAPPSSPRTTARATTSASPTCASTCPTSTVGASTTMT